MRKLRLRIIDFILIGFIATIMTFSLVWAANFYPFSNGLDGGASGDLDAKTGVSDKDVGFVVVNPDSAVTDFRAVTGAMGSAYALDADAATASQLLPSIVFSGDAGDEDWFLVPWLAQGFYATDGDTGAGWIRLFEDQDNGNEYGTVIGQSSLAANVTWTMPASTDTIVGRATTDTLTNKTIDADNNTVSNIGSTEITDDGVDSADYAAASIDNEHIADDQIDSEHYAADSIDNEHINWGDIPSTFQATLATPDTLQSETDAWEVLYVDSNWAASGIQLNECGISVQTPQAYTLVVELWTEAMAFSTVLESIAATTLGYFETGVLSYSTVLGNERIFVDLPTTDVSTVKVWCNFDKL